MYLLYTVLRSELLDCALGELLHVLGELVDVRPGHVVGLTVVPYQLDVPKHVLEGDILATLEQCFLDG